MDHDKKTPSAPPAAPPPQAEGKAKPVRANQFAGEIGGPRGPEPTRFGDWDINGRCTDF